MLRTVFRLLKMVVVTTPLTLFAQSPQSAHALWLHSYNQVHFGEIHHWAVDGGIRFEQGFSKAAQRIVRTAYGFQWGKFRLGAGIAWSGTQTPGSSLMNEIRPHQELLFESKYGVWRFNARYRSENRWRQAPSDSYGYQWRNRLMLLTGRALTPNWQRPISISLANELFVRSSAVEKLAFDQNRTIVALEWQYNSALQFAFQYNHQIASQNRSDVAWLIVRSQLFASER